MSRIARIATGCAIVDGDPERTAANLQGMLDDINALIGEDGWGGVKVTGFRFDRARGSADIEVEPGPSPLTLDYLRRLMDGRRATPSETMPAKTPGEQGRLL